MEENYKLYQGDCLEVMRNIKNEIIDICITDIPYGIDFCDWDTLNKNTN